MEYQGVPFQLAQLQFRIVCCRDVQRLDFQRRNQLLLFLDGFQVLLLHVRLLGLKQVQLHLHVLALLGKDLVVLTLARSQFRFQQLDFSLKSQGLLVVLGTLQQLKVNRVVTWFS